MPRPSIAQVLLGLFVTGQLLYLLAGNLLYLVRPELPPAAREVVDAAWTPVRRYEQATGQGQGWSMYAPNVPTQSPFVAVELRWDDGRPPVRLLSEYEPADVRHYYKPVGSARAAIYEAVLSLPLWTWDADAAAKDPDAWRTAVADHLRKFGPRIRAYLDWKSRAYLAGRPGLPPPDELTLVVRLYRVGPPGERPWHWRGPVEVPLCRWRPGAGPGAPLERYDPFDCRFVAAEGSWDG